MSENSAGLNKEKLLEAITKAQSSYIQNRDVRHVFDGLLLSLIELTDSEYGFIGEILHKADGTPYLRTHAISNIAWNTDTRKFYEENAPKGLEFVNLDTLFGYVIKHEEIVISNDPANDPRSGGLPKGHPPLNAFLGLPFFAEGALIGSAGISNRKGGYDNEVVSFLKPFIATCSNILLANKANLRQQSNEKIKSEIVSIVSHELRTPMTAIRGSLGILEGVHGKKLDKEAFELVQSANKGCDRMIRLLNDILDVQKIESGTVRIQPGEYDIKKIIDSAVSEVEKQDYDNSNKLVIDCQSDQTIFADQDMLQQIMINLISNAVKYTKNGTITIKCRDQGDSINIDVKDTGDGIPEDELSTVFDKFKQVEESSTRSHKGVGLGLYIVKKLVDYHQGSISIDSYPGSGTCFHLRFPKGWSANKGAND